MREDIEKLYDGAYFFVWAPKTNGLRFFAVACRFGQRPWLLLINRAQQVFALPNVLAADIIFDGSLIDGEVVPTDSGGYAFLAYDCGMTAGVPCTEHNYLVRLQAAATLIEAWNKTSAEAVARDHPNGQVNHIASSAPMRDDSGAAPSAGQPTVGGCVIEWRTKRVYAPDRFYEMLALELPRLDHDTDGFISTAVEPPIHAGHTPHIFKLKNRNDNTIDPLAVLAPPSTAPAADGTSGAAASKGSIQVDLVVGQGGEGALWATIDVSRAELLTLASKAGAGASADAPREWLHGRVVECRYEAKSPEPAPASAGHTGAKSGGSDGSAEGRANAVGGPGTWRIQTIRGDKAAPNALSTAQKTWRNIEENLSLQDVFPKGSLSDEQRRRLLDWERAHPLWKPPRNAPSSSGQLNLPLPLLSGGTVSAAQLAAETDRLLACAVATAPAPLHKLATFD
jgi:hypothetical protein